MEYSHQSDDTRLKRIEENVYGITSSKPVSIRMNRLSKDLSTDVIGQEIQPKKDSFLQADEIIAKPTDETMNYALVNNLEKKVFQYEFKTVDLNHRLSSLEGQVFKNNYSTDDLSTRINRLNDAVIYKKFPIADSKTAQYSSLIQKSPISDNKTLQTPFGPQQIFKTETIEEQKLISIINKTPKQEKEESDPNIQLLTLEKSVFNTTYPEEKTADRLHRLESKIFKSTFSENDNQIRLIRVKSAVQASSSIKNYEKNKESKLTSTAIELGTILLMIIPFLL